MNNFHIRIEDCTEAQKSIIQRIYGGVGLYEYLVSLTDVNIVSKYYASNSKLITPDEMFKRLGLDMCAGSRDKLSAPFELHSYSFEGEPLTLAQPANEMMHDVHEDLKAAEQKIKELESDKEHGTKIYKQLFDQYVKLQDDFKDLEQQLDKVSSQRDELFQDNETLRVKQPLPVDWKLAPDWAKVVVQRGDVIGWSKCELGGHKTLSTRPKPKYTEEQIGAANELYKDYLKDLQGQAQNAQTFQHWLKEQE